MNVNKNTNKYRIKSDLSWTTDECATPCTLPFNTSSVFSVHMAARVILFKTVSAHISPLVKAPFPTAAPYTEYVTVLTRNTVSLHDLVSCHFYEVFYCT